jgi:isopentenyldiphosphate isomerase
MAEQNDLASTEWVDIVNENNEVIAQSSREQMRAQCLRHRATYIVVHDGMGKILVQRRTEIKDFQPGMLDATAGVWCRPMSNCWIQRAAKRKKSWGLPACRSLTMVSFIMKINTVASGEACLAVSHGPFALQEEEVSEVCWLTPEEITARCDEFTPDSLKALALWMTRNANNDQVKTEKQDEAE